MDLRTDYAVNEVDDLVSPTLSAVPPLVVGGDGLPRPAASLTDEIEREDSKVLGKVPHISIEVKRAYAKAGKKKDAA